MAYKDKLDAVYKGLPEKFNYSIIPQIAKAMGVTEPTAKKYVQELEHQGRVQKVGWGFVKK